MDELRIAVIGAGRMGLTHAENLSHRIRGAQLAAVTTSSTERAEAVRRCCGDVPSYDNLERLLEDEMLDAVIISSSTSAHVQNVDLCAAAGLHILCEKPLGLSLDDCDRAAEATKAANVKLMIGHTRRFDAGYVEAKKLIESGAIGRPVLYRSLSGDVDPPPPEFANLGVSGGLILDSMYHDIYLGRWLMDQEITRVSGEGSAVIDDGVRSVGDVDNAVISARFVDGAVGTLSASRTTRYGHDLRTEVIGDEGAVQVGRLRKTPVRLLDRSGAHHDTVFTTPERMGDAFVSMLQEFVDCLVRDFEPTVGADDARATLAVAIAGRHSIQTGQLVSINSISDEPSLGGSVGPQPT
jgi:scyllo-inositol 2-dehydrogenase (NAD+)